MQNQLCYNLLNYALRGITEKGVSYMDAFRNQIFQEELLLLRQRNYLTAEEYEKMRQAHINCFNAMQQQQLQWQNQMNPQERLTQQPQRNQQQKQWPQAPQSPQNTKLRKELTSQEVKDRNITQILFLGVFLVLMSGLILATSNWSIMNNTLKTISLTFVSILFFALSWVAENKLKIQKTSMAFWSMGSLLIPISILSIGFFRLLGPWLSISGQGRYVLGLFGSLICLPIYAYSVLKYKKSLYTWFTFIALSAAVCFLLLALKLPRDFFYFGIIIYNSALLLIHQKFNIGEKTKLFIIELTTFIQVNLIISTLFILTVFHSRTFYGLNVILTALLYVAVMLLQDKKGFEHVFSILLVYGIYNIVENTVLSSGNSVLYAMIGFIFLAISNSCSDEKLRKTFKYTSGVVSCLAFAYISTIGNNKSSFLILAAYLIISVNYMYLSYKTNNVIFNWLTPFFLLAGVYISYELIPTSLIWSQTAKAVYLFTFSFMLFLILYYYNSWKYAKNIKVSSAVISMLAMCISMLSVLIYKQWLVGATLFYIFSLVLYISYTSLQIKELKELAVWIIPITASFGNFFLYGEISKYIYDNEFYTASIHLTLSILVVFVIGELFKKKDGKIAIAFFSISHGFLPFAILSSIVSNKYNISVFPINMILILGIYIYSIFRLKKELIIRTFMYLSFCEAALTLSYIFKYLGMNILWQWYVIYLCCAGIFLLWALTDTTWRRRIAIYLIPAVVISILQLAVSKDNVLINVLLMIAAIIAILYIMNYLSLQLFNILPLILLYLPLKNSEIQLLKMNNIKTLLLYVALFTILKITGEIMYTKIYDSIEEVDNKSIKYIDWYSVGSLICVLKLLQIHVPSLPILELIAPLMLLYFFYSQISRVSTDTEKRVVCTITILSILVPYYRLLNLLPITSLYGAELTVFPWLPLTIILSKKVWREYKASMMNIEYGVVIFVALFLFKDVLLYNNFADALIFGVLSLIAIIVGTQYKIKAYFLTGTAGLFLNVAIQTKGFWSSIPWWGYLLLAGIMLIVLASINEMKKHR
jgi:hypothetical protein